MVKLKSFGNLFAGDSVLIRVYCLARHSLTFDKNNFDPFLDCAPSLQSYLSTSLIPTLPNPYKVIMFQKEDNTRLDYSSSLPWKRFASMMTLFSNQPTLPLMEWMFRYMAVVCAIHAKRTNNTLIFGSALMAGVSDDCLSVWYQCIFVGVFESPLES